MIQTRTYKKAKKVLKVRTKIIKQNKNLKIFIKVIFLIKKKFLLDAKIAISKDFFISIKIQNGLQIIALEEYTFNKIKI